MTLAIGAGAVLLLRSFSSLRVNAPRLHPRGGGTHRLLVVLDADVGADELRSAVELRMVGGTRPYDS
jgi:hypothetical protein